MEKGEIKSLSLTDEQQFGITPFLFNFFFFFFFGFLGLHPRHMEVPRLGVQSELQLPAYPTAPATPDPSRVRDLHHNSRQSQILNPRSDARDRTRHLRVPSRFRFHCATVGTPIKFFLTLRSFGFASLL